MLRSRSGTRHAPSSASRAIATGNRFATEPNSKCGERTIAWQAGRHAACGTAVGSRPQSGAGPARRWCRRSRRSWTARCRSCASCALCGTRSMAVSTEGLSRLSVGGAMLSRMASTEKIASTAPAAPSRCPMADLVDDMASLPAALPNRRSTARELDLVAHRRRGAVRVDVVDVARLRRRRASAPSACSGRRRRRPRPAP